jgi:recombination protein RecR
MGARSAARIVIHLLKRRDTVMDSFIRSLSSVYNNSVVCGICGNIDDRSPCSICADGKRDDSIICVVCDIPDLWAIEKSGAFQGRYHVLGGKLSALDGVTPENLSVDSLRHRLGEDRRIKEVVLAMSADIDGQTTMFFVKGKIDGFDVKLTTLSQGIPTGGDLEYLDDGTIITAFNQRRSLCVNDKI